MPHRSSVLQKKIVFSTFHGPHHTLYIIFIEYDTIHRELDPSTTVIKKNHSLRCGHRPMWWMKFFIWDSIFPCWFKFKKKSKKDHYISISSILIASLYETYMLWSDFRCQLLDEWLRNEREREGGRFIYFSSMCISAGLCFKKMDGTVKYNILG